MGLKDLFNAAGSLANVLKGDGESKAQQEIAKANQEVAKANQEVARSLQISQPVHHEIGTQIVPVETIYADPEPSPQLSKPEPDGIRGVFEMERHVQGPDGSLDTYDRKEVFREGSDLHITGRSDQITHQPGGYTEHTIQRYDFTVPAEVAEPQIVATAFAGLLQSPGQDVPLAIEPPALDVQYVDAESNENSLRSVTKSDLVKDDGLA